MPLEDQDYPEQVVQLDLLVLLELQEVLVTRGTQVLLVQVVPMVLRDFKVLRVLLALQEVQV